MTQLPFTLETPLERTLAADPIWQRGVRWGTPRPGHLEGQVMYHIADVLANIERQATSPEERRKLRLIALTHDTLKAQVDTSKPRVGANHHAARARAWASHYIDDPHVLRVIETHDDAYHAWRYGARTERWDDAEREAERLIERLGDDVPLYVRFFRSDNDTASKNPAPVRWFEDLLRQRGIEVPDASQVPDAASELDTKGKHDDAGRERHGHIPDRHS